MKKSLTLLRRLMPAVLVGLVLPLAADNLRIKPYVTVTRFASDDEMLQGSITWTGQDQRGLIWVASFNGLNKYDGYQWNKYKSRPSGNSVLGSNRIDIFWENSLGNFYCDAGNRLYLFDAATEKFSDIQTILDQKSGQSPHIRRIWSLPNHYSYLTGDNGEVFRISDEHPEQDCQRLELGLKSNDMFFNVMLDSHGQEWILTNNGVFHPQQAQPVTTIPLRFFAEKGDDIWITAAHGKTIGIFSHTQQQFTWLDFIPHNGYVYEQKILSDSMILVASGAGLWQVSLDRGAEGPRIRQLSDLVFQHIYPDSRSEIWALTTDLKIYRLKPQADGSYEVIPTERPADHAFSDSRLRFHEDDNHRIWALCHDNDDILYFDESEARWERPLYVYEGKQSQATRGSFIDRQGNIWYSSQRSIEMLEIHNDPFLHFEGEDPVEVRALLLDSYGRLWIGQRNHKVLCVGRDGQALGSLEVQGTAYCFYEDQAKNLWIGCKEGGLYRLPNGSLSDPKAIAHYLHDDLNARTLSNNDIYSITQDSQGHLWIATFGGGLNLFADGEFIHKDNKLGYGSQLPTTIRCLLEVRPGVMMVGARNGLFVFDNRFDAPENIRMFHNSKRIDDRMSLPDNDIMDIVLTRDSDIILTTTSGGICLLNTPFDDLLNDNLGFVSLAKEDGLASDVAYSAVEDPQQNLWVINGQALSRLQKKNITERAPIDGPAAVSVYDIGDFPDRVAFSECSPVLDGSCLILGTMNGIFLVQTDQLESREYVPPIIIENTSRELNNTQQTRAVSLRFAALDYRDKRHLRYAYRLSGVDKAWNITDDNQVTYINLPKGNNVFHVRSTDAAGIWQDNEQTLTLYIKPKFHETLLGILALFLAALAVLSLIAYYVIRAYRLRHELAVEQENTQTKLRFFTDISHELRTPLTLIDGPVSEVLADPELSEQSHYYLEVVQKNVRRLLNLINQILDFRKLQNHKMSLLIEPIDIAQLLRQVMDNFAELARSRHIDLQLQCTDDLPPLWADRDKMEKIFFNLLSNAFKYTSDHKAITLSAQVDGKDPRHIVIAVADQGRGIKREDIDQLFRRFETVMQNNLFQPSSGIGLSLVKQFVELHHAQIHVDSQVDVGSTFSMTFQEGRTHFERDNNVEFYVQDGPKAPQDSSAERSETSEEPQGAGILVVEDNEELREFVGRILGGEYRVITACNGEEGLRLGRQQWPDLVITDIMMPKMDGFEMIRHFKEDPDLYTVPIIALTAKGALDDKIQGVKMGVDDYVLKPFSASYLKARVAALLEQRRRLQQRFMELLSQGGNALTRRSIEPNMPEITPADELFIQEVMAFMESNMDNAELTIDQFANALRMGRTVFYNKIKSILGLTPIDFVQEMRIKRAVQYMKSSDFTIAEIAYQTGFNDPKYFSRSFKKHMNVTPSEYMKSLKDR